MMRAISPSKPFLHNSLEALKRIAHMTAFLGGTTTVMGATTTISNLVHENPTQNQIISTEEGAQFGLLLTVGGALSAAASLKVSEGLNRKLDKDFPLS